MIFEKAINELKEENKAIENTKKLNGILNSKILDEIIKENQIEIDTLIKCSNAVEEVLSELKLKIGSIRNKDGYYVFDENGEWLLNKINYQINLSKEELKEVELK